jgi:DNA-binding CsgD family transcriptional regulator
MPEDFVAHCRALSDLLGDIYCGIVAAQEGRGIVYANPRLLGWLQREEEEVIGRTFAEVLLVPELADDVALEAEVIAQGDRRLRMAVLHRRDRSTFPALLVPHVVRVTDAPGWALVLVLDIGSIQTAKPALSQEGSGGMREQLHRIAIALQALALTAATSMPGMEHTDLKGLSAREKEIVSHLLQGRRVPSIASHLRISPHTVRNHLKSIFDKLGVRSQTHLVEHVRGLHR